MRGQSPPVTADRARQAIAPLLAINALQQFFTAILLCAQAPTAHRAAWSRFHGGPSRWAGAGLPERRRRRARPIS